ncbi:MAG: chemotaxis protein CheB, partial [Campylobacteraceae bacterium]|nr:chemotaxis protein CheB [Campylobacteraceae bacterium]
MEVKKLILIGASTGGPGQIQKIIKFIKKDFNATIVIVQHMKSGYLQSFVKQ